MIVSSTEVQNNFGRYLMLAAKEPVIITKNGVPTAKLISFSDSNEAAGEVDKGEDIVAEKRLTSKYIYGGEEADYEEFLELTRNNEKRYEYIDGEIYTLASPVTTHQNIVQEIFLIFHNYFNDKGCQPMLAPYDIRLKRSRDDINIVQPDLMIICDLEDKLDDRDYYLGVPDLVVEVISKSSRSKDMVKKLDLYMKCGIKEYWIVDPHKEEALVYLFKGKEIEDFSTYSLSGKISSFHFKGLVVDFTDVF